MKSDINDEILPILKDGTKIKIENKETEEIPKDELIKKSKKQSIAAFIMLILSYSFIVFFIIYIKSNNDSFMGILNILLFGGIPIIGGIVLWFIGFIFNALSNKNNPDNNIVSINNILIAIPLIYFIISFLKNI